MREAILKDFEHSVNEKNYHSMLAKCFKTRLFLSIYVWMEVFAPL